MPKLAFSTNRRPVAGQHEKHVAELSLEGFIDAANFRTFEKALERVAGMEAEYLVVDFARVHYINSTGISVLIRYHQRCRDRGGLLCLAAVSREVGLSMHLLGVTTLIPFCRDVPDAERYVTDFAAGRIRDSTVGLQGQKSETKRQKLVLRGVKRRSRKDASVLVIAPWESRFTRILRLRFKHLNGAYHLLHSIEDALGSYDEINPDLVVVDDRCDPKGEFVNRVKIQREKSLTSVIKLYGKEVDVEGSLDFKIWENDFLVEPFEVLEFFSLTEAELDRVPKDRRVFCQQVHFEFRSDKKNIEKATKLSELIIRSGHTDEESATALYAATKEGLDNAIVHGNKSAPGKKIDVNILVDQRKMTVIVEDDGKGFDYEYYLTGVAGKDAFEDAKKKILEDGTQGGLGILLMSRCTDRIEYLEAGNLLRLEKNL